MDIAALAAERDALKEQVETLSGQLRAEKVGTMFRTSRYVADLALPVEMVRATFAKHFDFDGDRLVAKDANGSRIYSARRIGEPADFDEAVATLVEASPHRGALVKRGGSKPQSAPGVPAPGGSVSRRAFDALSPAARIAHIRAGGTLHD